jgi:hypothetical protein
VFRLSGSTDWARLSVRSAVFDSFMAQCVCTAHTHTHMKRMWVREEGGGRSDARILLKGELYEEKEEEAGPSPSRHHSWKHMASSLFNNNQSSSKLL